MQTIRFMYPEEAAAKLVANAPACGDYWAYGARIPRDMRDRMRCDKCGAAGCKMWREYQTYAEDTKILCGPCAMADQGKTGTIDADGKHEDDLGKCDQIGWMVPAVPTHDGTFWGYTSVPADGVEWWRTLPSMPTGRVS